MRGLPGYRHLLSGLSWVSRGAVLELNMENNDWAEKTVDLKGLFYSYLGVNAEKYLRAQEYFQNHPGSKLFWNWAAALLGPIWLYYRKMYSWLLVWLLIGVPFDFVYFASPLMDPNSSSPIIAVLVKYYGLLSLAYILLTNIIVGCWGTYYYLQRAQNLVSLVKAKAPHTVAAVILAEKGNPSKWRFAGGVLLIGGLYLISYLSACLWLVLR